MIKITRLVNALLLGGFAFCASPAEASCDNATVLTTRDLDLGMLRYQPGLETGWALLNPNGSLSLASGLSLSSRTPAYPGQVRLRARLGYDVTLSIEIDPPVLGGTSKVTEIYADVSRGSISSAASLWVVKVPMGESDFEFTDINIDIGAYFYFSKIGFRSDKLQTSSVRVSCVFERRY